MLNGGDLRVLLPKCEQLEKDSEICVNKLCTLDVIRIYLEQISTTLKYKLQKHLGFRV